MSWRVGSKTQVTLFKGEELYGMLLDPEKAAVVVANLNLAAEKDRWPSERTPDWLLAEFSDAVWDETVRRRRARHGVEAGGRQAEGGAEGDPVALREDGARGAVGTVGARDGGGCPPGCDGGGPDGHF